MNYGLRTYQSSCRSFTEEEEELDDEIAVLTISIADYGVLATLGYFMHKRATLGYSMDKKTTPETQ